ncbi:molybdate ABC transporter substrate-binding protein [Pararhizobium mangrovi]|uniref:Molybdate ABC transporter substrate-binding protein n=1 Tax=Pararhizobium mangrovi TaxID=2590452 RepID=A0A506UD96_9HYPH|nr:molybdate ABC transporter substrate-binding protein [Pararhizobium mangrovi]TPW31910.1 molybdate ABC transporter substrate-binding protein [Pararhizobium mangrovi]
MLNRRSFGVGIAAALFAFGTLAGPAMAATARVAVAANFTAAAKEIGTAFQKQSGDTIDFSFGSTGQLYNQISNGAPFDVFLAADTKRPKMALDQGYAVKGTDFTYAIGQIVLYSTDADLVKGKQTLTKADFDKIAIANPKTAPYGTAAVQAMKAMGVYASLKPKVVQGNNIAQTFQFVESGNAALGFVAFSEVAQSEKGSRWVVPSDTYDPIRQNAVILKNGKGNAVAKAFVDFLKGPQAARIIKKYGYATAKGN